MLAPSSANRLAIASPIPRLPPEINTVVLRMVEGDTQTPFITAVIHVTFCHVSLIPQGADPSTGIRTISRAAGLSCPRDVTRLGVWRLRLRLCWGFWWPSYVLAWVLSWDVEPHPVVAPLVTRPYCGSN